MTWRLTIWTCSSYIDNLAVQVRPATQSAAQNKSRSRSSAPHPLNVQSITMLCLRCAALAALLLLLVVVAPKVSADCLQAVGLAAITTDNIGGTAATAPPPLKWRTCGRGFRLDGRTTGGRFRVLPLQTFTTGSS